jgi:hypothetical protein
MIGVVLHKVQEDKTQFGMKIVICREEAVAVQAPAEAREGPGLLHHRQLKKQEIRRKHQQQNVAGRNR